MFQSPKGYPVLVYAQGKNGFNVFFGLVFRIESMDYPADGYRGSVSVVRVLNGFGQNAELEVHHNVEHYSNSHSITHWAYPNEIQFMRDKIGSVWVGENQSEFDKITSWLSRV